ncbi:hypothetical protein GCM10007205_09050 [Oxalicibacterium flavum]|uniref:Uncharacterized protein n=1 Tax=Oxalicibacterium flavum TaxID=179467 RepID=A0A8J2XYU0_9BURK|nr:hypothetical protein [Oxalicibacterium flavum]GGC01995.1 hypothetical protein GCM10007205_09050 [Oxalicibacterium flavum]
MPDKHMIQEDDIGSGERSPGAADTEKEIRKVGKRADHPDREQQKQEEKDKGLVDEDHPFPSKGN